MAFLRLIRPINLFIIAITFWLFWNELFLDAFQENQVEYVLSGNSIILFTIMILCLAAGGYVINDILDVSTDLINKKEKIIVTELITKKGAWTFYGILNISALIISIYLAIQLQNYSFIGICGLSILLLWWYSRYLKSTILMGNVLVAILIALVPFVLLVIESNSLINLSAVNETSFIKVVSIIIAYSIFAFLTNLVREIIKDCEDAEGDMKARILTIATVLGLKKADRLSTIILFILLGMTVFWLLGMDLPDGKGIALFCTLVQLPAILILYYIYIQERNKTKYTNLSLYVKGLMGSGLIYLFIYLNF